MRERGYASVLMGIILRLLFTHEIVGLMLRMVMCKMLVTDSEKI
jgi:hypothetical protein